MLVKATDFLSRLMTNKSEDANTLTEVSSNLLLALGNILKISSEDASFYGASSTLGQPWYKIDEKKVLQH